jgi:hypothetical protein
LSGTRPLWLATLGWGTDPWWDVTGRTARRRARRRLLDLALVVAVLAAFVSTSGTGARIAGAAVESEPRSPAAAPVDAPRANQAATPLDEPQPVGAAAGAAAGAALDRTLVPDPTNVPNLAPWAAILIAMGLAFGATLRTRSRRPR